MSRRRMYLAFASSPETRNFICGNICLQIGIFDVVTYSVGSKVLGTFIKRLYCKERHNL